jgi:Flp pilus assembly pilin Flp
MTHRATRTRLTRDDSGAITAELALVLPVVAMIIAVALSSLAAQVERMRLVSIAAGLARAVGRGESEMVALKRFEGSVGKRKVAFSDDQDLVCAEVSIDFAIFELPGAGLRLADRECARKLGL